MSRSNSTPSSRAGNGYTRVAGDSESERSGAEDLETDQEDGEQEGQEGGETTRIHSKSISITLLKLIINLTAITHQ